MTVMYTPGISASRPTMRRRAMAFLLAVAVGCGLVALVVRVTPAAYFDLVMVTPDVAAGIGRNTAVQFNGVAIGRVGAVTAPVDGRRSVVLRIDNAYRGVVTTSTSVSYAPSNLFGIASVVLQSRPGGRSLAAGEEFVPNEAPDDATLTALLRTMTDLDEKAFGPNMGTILVNANAAVAGLMPVIGATGELAEMIASTQRLSTAQTIPHLADLVGTSSRLVENLMPGLRRVWEWSGPTSPGYPKAQAATIRGMVDDLVPAFLRMEVPAVLDLVRTIMPVWRSMTARAHSTFPDARANGLQMQRLIDDINAAMPAKDGGVALNVDVIVGSLPGVAAALGLTKAGPR